MNQTDGAASYAELFEDESGEHTCNVRTGFPGSLDEFIAIHRGMMVCPDDEVPLVLHNCEGAVILRSRYEGWDSEGPCTEDFFTAFWPAKSDPGAARAYNPDNDWRKRRPTVPDYTKPLNMRFPASVIDTLRREAARRTLEDKDGRQHTMTSVVLEALRTAGVLPAEDSTPATPPEDSGEDG